MSTPQQARIGRHWRRERTLRHELAKALWSLHNLQRWYEAAMSAGRELALDNYAIRTSAMPPGNSLLSWSPSTPSDSLRYELSPWDILSDELGNVFDVPLEGGSDASQMG